MIKKLQPKYLANVVDFSYDEEKFHITEILKHEQVNVMEARI